MKQIFDSIKVELGLKRAKYISEELRDRESGLDLSADRTQLRRFGVEDAIKIVAEAEAKWEADCCEWTKPSKEHGFIKNPHTGRIFSNEPSMQNVYCNTCGKPIKISEVE